MAGRRCRLRLGAEELLAASNKLSALQIIANHHMQSISFASGGDPVSTQGPRPCVPCPVLGIGASCPLPEVSGTALPGGPVSPLLSHPQDTAEYVAYVAKDPVNQRGEAAAEGPKCQRPDSWMFRHSSVWRGGTGSPVRRLWGAQSRLEGWRT